MVSRNVWWRSVRRRPPLNSRSRSASRSRNLRGDRVRTAWRRVRWPRECRLQLPTDGRDVTAVRLVELEQVDDLRRPGHKSWMAGATSAPSAGREATVSWCSCTSPTLPADQQDVERAGRLDQGSTKAATLSSRCFDEPHPVRIGPAPSERPPAPVPSCPRRRRPRGSPVAPCANGDTRRRSHRTVRTASAPARAGCPSRDRAPAAADMSRGRPAEICSGRTEVRRAVARRGRPTPVLREAGPSWLTRGSGPHGRRWSGGPHGSAWARSRAVA